MATANAFQWQQGHLGLYLYTGYDEEEERPWRGCEPLSAHLSDSDCDSGPGPSRLLICSGVDEVPILIIYILCFLALLDRVHLRLMAQDCTDKEVNRMTP